MCKLLEKIAEEYRGVLLNPIPLCFYDPDAGIQSDLNGISIQSFNGKPTPLEFSRMVHISRPVVFRGEYAYHTKHCGPISLQSCIFDQFEGCWTKEDLPALAFWSDEHLEQIMGDSPISVAVTPHGFASNIG
jgi:jumonji domain-containing protein 7